MYEPFSLRLLDMATLQFTFIQVEFYPPSIKIIFAVFGVAAANLRPKHALNLNMAPA